VIQLQLSDSCEFFVHIRCQKLYTFHSHYWISFKWSYCSYWTAANFSYTSDVNHHFNPKRKLYKKKPHTTASLFLTGYIMKPNSIIFLNILFSLHCQTNITLLYIRFVTVMVLLHYKFKYQRHDCGNWGSMNTLKRYVTFKAIDIPHHTTKPYPTHPLPAEYQKLKKNLNITIF
jgi:hypothetical protein